MQKLFDTLRQLHITYDQYEHVPLFSCDEASAVYASLPPFTRCKNLFLKDDKKRLWLLVAQDTTAIKLRPFSKIIDAPGLRFADAQLLLKHLGVTPGSVAPFGLLYDESHTITVILDKAVIDSDKAGFHPLQNTATLVLSPGDLMKFIEFCGHTYIIHDFS